MYILIYDADGYHEGHDTFDSLEEMYTFIKEHGYYIFIDCYKIEKSIDIDIILKRIESKEADIK